ncbi:unnamed protein product [Rhizophagus irregularis]|nr:unnamed protein product [Rhizophagus irregularis]
MVLFQIKLLQECRISPISAIIFLKIDIDSGVITREIPVSYYHYKWLQNINMRTFSCADVTLMMSMREVRCWGVYSYFSDMIFWTVCDPFGLFEWYLIYEDIFGIKLVYIDELKVI